MGIYSLPLLKPDIQSVAYSFFSEHHQQVLTPAAFNHGDTVYWISLIITDPGLLSGAFLRACRSLSSHTREACYDIYAETYRAQCISSTAQDVEKNAVTASNETIAKVLLLSTDDVSFHFSGYRMM
jgi:hypothetical protein